MFELTHIALMVGLITAWGVVPIRLKEQINLSSIVSISTSTRDSFNSEFSVCVLVQNEISRKNLANLSDSGSVQSDSVIGENSSKIIRFKAPDAQVCMHAYLFIYLRIPKSFN